MAVINPTAEFTLPQKYSTDRRGSIRWLFSHAIRQYHLVLLSFVGAVVNAVLASVTPILIGQAFNDIMENPPNVSRLGYFALLIGVTQVCRGLLQFARNFGFEIIAQRMERNIRNELYITLLGKSMTFHSLQSVGDTMARATNDVREVNFLFSPGLNIVIGSLVFLFMPLILAPRYHPSLVLVPAIFIVSYFLLLWQYLNSLAPLTDEVRASFGQLNSRLSESLDGIEIVKGSSQEEGEVRRFRMNADRYRKAVVSQADLEGRFLPLLLYMVAIAFGFLQALILVHNGILNVGQLISFIGLLMLLDFPVYSSMWAYSQISLGLAGARRILNLMNIKDHLDQNKSGYSEPIRGEVEFKDISFSYNGEEPGLEHVSIHITPGQTVAIVGQTGAGKTSLVKLINRTYDVDSGEVLVDGVNVREWNLEVLRQGISMIEQDIFLFSRSAGENIAFGKQNSTQDEIISAAKSAQAHEFITSFEDGYQTILGERGITLSGGQRQRLALARAFLTDPRILILDDSTSAIDSATEDLIQRAIYAAAQGRTTFIITHRLSQIRWADQIIVLKKGRVAAIGRHEELLKNSEAYQKIFSE
jgi:ATP-binding cassette, subfamily B, bacterial